MDFDGRQSFPAVYGEFRKGELKNFIVAIGADPRITGGLVSPGDGLWVLEIQDRIYKFLLDIVQRILHDIPTGDLTGPKYSIQPEPSLPSANCRRDGVASLASTNLEAAYSAPGRVDLHRLQLLVEAKASEEEDKLWDFREDPGRFTEGLKEFIAYQPACVPDLSGTQKLATSIDGCGTEPGSNTKTTEDLFGIKFLLSNFKCVAFWSCLARDIASLVELKKKFFDNSKIELGDPLPEPFELSLHKIQFSLCLGIDLRLTSLLREAHASPPIRPYFRRASPDTIDNFVPNPGKIPPRHISDFLLFLYRLTRDDCFTSMGHIAGVQSLLEQYDKFIHTDPDAHRAVSSYVAQDISYLSLLSECLRQTHLFEPWAATYHEESEILHVQDVLNSQFKDLEREIRPVETVNFSAQLRRMPSAIAECQYPVYKKRTAANVDAMQSAETLLDQMWDAFLAEMEQQNALNTHVKNVLFSQGRPLQRTPDWVEPVKPINERALQLATPDVLVQPFGELNMDDTRKVQSSPREKSKIKTRGIAALQPPDAAQGQATEQEDQRAAQTIQVDQRALKVFSTLFHTPSSTSQPGDVPWTEFLHAMRSAGFGMESLQGSAWQFTPRDDIDSGIGPGKRSILFHEPHPTHRIPFWDARRHGRRLARAYGWSGETFVAN